MTRKDIQEKYSPELENLLLILIDIQNSSRENYLSKEDLTWVADYLGITLATVYGIVKYYSMLSTKPRGRNLIRLCQSPVCSLFEADNIGVALESILQVKEGQVSGDGLFSFENVACLGQCEKAPSLMINDAVYGKVTTQKLEEIISNLRGKI